MPERACVVNRDEPSLPVCGESCFAHAPQRENFLIAQQYWHLAGYAPEALSATTYSFKLPAHRLQRVAEITGVTFWNDSKATNFAAALAAVGAVDGPVYWIGGGKAKGGDLKTFAEQLSENIEGAFLIGETAETLADLLENKGILVQRVVTLYDAVCAAFEAAGNGSAVVFSPGFSSQDQFLHYAQRGEHFEAAVDRLTHNCKQDKTLNNYSKNN